MNRILKAQILVSVLISTGCASTRIYEAPKVQQTLSESLQHSDELAQHAQNDYNEKKSLIDTLAHAHPSGFAAAEPGLRASLSEMQSQLKTMTESRARMMSVNSDLASQVYGRGTIRRNDPEFEKIESGVQEFQLDKTAADQAQLSFAKTSSALMQSIVDKKLFLTFQSADFFKRVQQSVRVAQETSRGMQKEIYRSEELHALAQSYTDRAQRLGQISTEMRNVTADAPVNSLDPQWPKVQRLVNEHTQLVQELTQMSASFQKGVEALRAAERSGR